MTIGSAPIVFCHVFPPITWRLIIKQNCFALCELISAEQRLRLNLTAIKTSKLVTRQFKTSSPYHAKVLKLQQSSGLCINANRIIYIYNKNTYKEGLYAILSIVGLFEHWAIDGLPNGYSVMWDGRTPDHACLYHDLRSRYGSTHVQGYLSGPERGNTV